VSFVFFYHQILTSGIKSSVLILVVKMTGKKADDTFKGRVVIQRMIREVGGGTSYLVLTKTNYSDSVLLMKLKFRVLRTDHGNEFTVRKFVEYCAIENVRRQHTTPYNPQ
jgi:hypothetical protein